MLLSSRINKISSILGKDPVIIEGIKDRKALSRFGITNMIEISGKPLIQVADLLQQNNATSVTILTDFDEDGRSKNSQLSQYLSQYGIKINSLAREKTKSLFKIHKIEELSQFTKFMEDDYTGKVSSIYDKIFSRSRIHNRWRGGKTRRHRSDIWSN